jgi:chromosome segregation ATPase
MLVDVASSILFPIVLYYLVQLTMTILQEKLLREEALFEQRKLASAEQLKYAEDRIQTANHMDAKLQSEMDRLIELCDFVTKKDAEANDKLANASDLYEKAQELEASLMSDAEVIEHQKQQLERDRNLLVRERVSVLKEKSINRDMCMSANSKVYTNDACYPVGVRGRSGSLATDPDIVLRKRLASIKSQLSKLRD